MKNIITSVLALCTIGAYAQQAPSQPLNLSMQQAMELGLKNRYDLQSKKYNSVLSQSEVYKSKKEWIPEVNATGNLRYSPELQATFVPGGFFGPDGALIALGATNVATMGLELNQPIYKPGITTDVKIAKNNTALATEKNRQDENTVKEDILYAYLNVVLKNLQYNVAVQEEDRYKEYNSIAEGKFKQGAMIEMDYKKAQLDYENAKVQTQKAKQQYDLSMLYVKYQMNIPEATVVVLTDTLNSENFNRPRLEVKPDIANRTELKQLMIKQNGVDLELNRTRQAALPTVSLYGNYSTQYTYTDFSFNSQWWSTFNYVGLQVRVPITGNFKNHNNIEERKIKSTQVDLDIKQKTADVNYEVQKTGTEMANALDNKQMTERNYLLSQEIYENQKQQFGLGSKSYSDLLETNRALILAEQNYIKAVYDYMVSNINYQKAIGNL